MRFGRAGRVEDAESFVLGEPLDRQPAVLRTGGEDDGARGDHVTVFQPDDVASVPRFERDRPIRRRRPGIELPRLGDGAARQLGSADTGGKPQVVLDPARRAGLPTQGRALDNQRFEALGRSVDRRSETRRPSAHHEQVDPLPRCKLEADSERAHDLAGRRSVHLRTARQSHERKVRLHGRGRLVPGEGKAIGPCEFHQAHRRLGRAWPDDLEADALHPLQRLAPGHERRQKEVAERAIVEEQRSQILSVDGDVPEGPGDDRRQVDRLPGQQVHLAEELRLAVADDLVVCGVEDRHLALEDRDQGIALIADAKQHVADACCPLLTMLGERRQLGRGQQRAGGSFH